VAAETKLILMLMGANITFPRSQSSLEELRPSGERLNSEMSALQQELKAVEEEISAVKSTLFGLSVIYGEEVFPQHLLEAVRVKRETKSRGLTATCQAVMSRATRPCTVSEVCDLVRRADPLLLVHLRNPRASVMTVLRNFAKRGQVIRGTENRRSVWQWTGTGPVI
jgi:hypothetical protein